MIFKLLPPKVRVVLGSVLTAIVAGTLIGLVVVTAKESDFETATNQAKVIVPVLSIIFFVVIYFGLKLFQDLQEQPEIREQQEKQNLQARFDLARTLIEGHHYAQARKVLGAIKDPKAREWETKLRRRKPDNPNFLQKFQ
jgi:TRAP-type C4-dicarboxylate transport system permease small subunit